MQNEIFDRPHRRHIKEINIVPILDMLTTVIFFLLLSATFVEYSKVTVPPSRVSVSTDPVKPPPVQPRLSINKFKEGYIVVLNWSGVQPGRRVESLGTQPVDEAQLGKVVGQVIEDFKKNYPSENTLQMGLGPDLSYQNLITAMDAVRGAMPDIVLYSPLEAESESQGLGNE